MKLTLEIQGHQSGYSNSKGTETAWTHLWGKDSNGRFAKAKFYGARADAVNKSLHAKLGEGETVDMKRMVIVLDGEWKQEAAAEGKRPQRSFYVGVGVKEGTPVFKILDGLELEFTRLRKDALSVLENAEKLRGVGQLAMAYEAVGQLVAKIAGVPLDLTEFLAQAAADDAEYGQVAEAEFDPEAQAAATFARADRARDVAHETTAEKKPDPTDASEPAAEAASTETPSDPVYMDFGADEELGAAPTAEALREEDAIVIEDTPSPETPARDVLEDAPQPEEKAAEAFKEQAAAEETPEPAPAKAEPPKPQPVAAKQPPFASKPSFQPQRPVFQASKPFQRPEMPERQVAEPAARQQPEQHREEAEQKPQASVPSFSNRPRF